MRDELESHVDAHAADLVHTGIEPAEAQRRALLALGGVQQTATLCADSEASCASVLMADVVEVSRRLRRHRRFSVGIVVIVGLAIAAVAIVAAVTQAVLLTPLPYPASDRLVVGWQRDHASGTVVEVSYRDFVDWRARQTAFADLAAMGSVHWNERLTGVGEPADVAVATVTGSFFTVMGTGPLLGRGLTQDDDRPNATPVAVVSYGFWQQRLSGDPAALGRTVRLDGRLVAIVGIMPRAFDFPRGTEVWAPLVPALHAVSTSLGSDALEARWLGVLFVMGRLRSDASLEQATAQLASIHRSIERSGRERAATAVVLTPLEERLVGRTAVALRLLVVAVGLITLIAASNAAALLLQRAARGQRDTDIRVAMGASATSLRRLWLIETGTLFTVAATAGLTGAAWVIPSVIRLAPDSIYRIGEARVTAAVVVASLLLAWISASVAALLVSRVTLSPWRTPRALNEATHVTASRTVTLTRRALVCGELTLAVVLLIGAGLTLRSFVGLQNLDLGFDHEGVLTFDVSPPNDTPAASSQFYAPLLERLTAMPLVEQVGAVLIRPLEHETIGSDAAVLSDSDSSDDEHAWQTRAVTVNSEVATPGYFATLRVPLKDGRLFTDSDDANALPVALLSESAAARLFPGAPSVGRRVASNAEGPAANGQRVWRTVVGVVADVRYRGLQDRRLDYYVPAAQSPDSEVKHFVVRTTTPLAVIAFARQAALQLNPGALVDRVTTMTSVVDRAAAPWRLYMVLFVVLGLTAAMMAGVGVAVVIRSSVTERLPEFGVRVALGATPGQATRLVMREGVLLLAVGLVVGWPIAEASVGLMQSMLFDVEAHDRMTFAIAAAGLGALTLLASYLPARAAGRVNPMQLLKSA